MEITCKTRRCTGLITASIPKNLCSFDKPGRQLLWYWVDRKLILFSYIHLFYLTPLAAPFPLFLASFFKIGLFCIYVFKFANHYLHFRKIFYMIKSFTCLITTLLCWFLLPNILGSKHRQCLQTHPVLCGPHDKETETSRNKVQKHKMQHGWRNCSRQNVTKSLFTPDSGGTQDCLMVNDGQICAQMCQLEWTLLMSFGFLYTSVLNLLKRDN